jgi:hypothetical protein
VTRLTGEFAGFGQRSFVVRSLGSSDQTPPDAWTAVRLLRPGTQVELTLQRPGTSFTLAAPRASYLTDDGAFAAMFEPGELTQSLCSPWTHDFRDCGCFYWASNHPDIVLPALPTGVVPDDPEWGVRTLWLRSARGDGPPPAPDDQHSGEMAHLEINARWQDLDVALDGREQRVPYAPDVLVDCRSRQASWSRSCATRLAWSWPSCSSIWPPSSAWTAMPGRPARRCATTPVRLGPSCCGWPSARCATYAR